MNKESAIKAINNYLAEKAEAEKARTGMLWLNPVFSDAYDGNYKTVVDGKEYCIALTGFAGWPQEGYAVYSGKEHMTIKNEDLDLD